MLILVVDTHGVFLGSGLANVERAREMVEAGADAAMVAPAALVDPLLAARCRQSR